MPLKYLGCMLYKGRARRQYFQDLVDKITLRLNGWSRSLLSQGGRLCLIKHVLSAIPLHTLAVLEPPKQVLRQMELLFSRFFWGNDKHSWRSWRNIAFPLQENGLGVQSLGDIVAGYSCKMWWKWKLGIGFWARFANALSWPHSFFGRRLQAVDAIMRMNTRRLVCSGSSSMFMDNWSGVGALADLYDIYLTPVLERMTIADFYVNGQWDMLALDDVLCADAKAFIQTFHFQLGSERDGLIWEPTPSGLFTLSSAIAVMRPRNVVKPILGLIYLVF